MVTIKIDEARMLNGDFSLFVSFPYDIEMIDYIRDMTSRFWHVSSKEWEIPVKQLGNLIDKFSDREFDISGSYVSLQKKVAEVPTSFSFKTKPFEHQLEAFHYGLDNDRWLLGDEQGLGKTKQVIDIAVARKLMRGYRHCLIICGVNSLKWNWVNEIHTHSDEGAYILGQRICRDRVTIGSNADKLSDVNRLDGITEYFIITNIETLRDKEIVEALRNSDIGMIAMDECHKAKNPSSDQAKGLLKLQAETMIAMTGTPLMNQPFDLYVILKWLGYEKHAFYAFRKHYAEFGGFGGYEVIRYKNLDELQDRLDEIMLRRLKSDVFDLPDKLYIDELVEMGDKQKRIYDEVTMDIKMHIDEIKMSNNPLAELIRMRQATGYTGILSSTIHQSAKLDRMEELVEEAVQNGKKVVIFSNWTQMTDVIYERLHNKNYGVAVITGETKDDARQTVVENFQTDNYYKVLVGTIGAMGTGLTLTAGTVEIFMDEPWNKALKDQAEDRCHRIGTTENITIYTLMCKDTIDERIHALIEKKGLMADALVDGKLDMSNSEVLDFLLN